MLIIYILLFGLFVNAKPKQGSARHPPIFPLGGDFEVLFSSNVSHSTTPSTSPPSPSSLLLQTNFSRRLSHLIRFDDHVSSCYGSGCCQRRLFGKLRIYPSLF